jgi:hypothetical protein
MKAPRSDNSDMDPVAIALTMAVTTLVLAALRFRSRRTGDRRERSRKRRADIEPHRLRSAAEAEMEEHDIDDMLNAINRRRRQLGRRDIGEELADELLRGTWGD